MDKKAAKRIDSVYRNVKQLPLLGCLGFLIPIIGVILLPIALAYLYLRGKLLRDFEAGRIVVEKHDQGTTKPGELTTAEKIEFLQYQSPPYFWAPIAIGTVYVLIMLLIVFSVVVSGQN